MTSRELTAWARIQEGLLELIDPATALQQMVDSNPTVAINPDGKQCATHWIAVSRLPERR